MILNTAHGIGWEAGDFALQGVDGKIYSLAEVRGPKGTLVVFICNHCPYVQASISRIVMEANALREIGIGTIAINRNGRGEATLHNSSRRIAAVLFRTGSPKCYECAGGPRSSLSGARRAAIT